MFLASNKYLICQCLSLMREICQTIFNIRLLTSISLKQTLCNVYCLNILKSISQVVFSEFIEGGFSYPPNSIKVWNLGIKLELMGVYFWLLGRFVRKMGIVLWSAFSAANVFIYRFYTVHGSALLLFSMQHKWKVRDVWFLSTFCSFRMNMNIR